jgi:hypothetical protein
MPKSPEKLVMAKELTTVFADRGIDISYRYARALIAECPQTVRGRYIVPSDALAWWCAHPDWLPFRRTKQRQHALDLRPR